MERIAVIDYRMGNLRSVAKALEHVVEDAAEVCVCRDANAIANADRVVFPGQGAIRDCMAELERHGLEAAVRDAIETRPFLGICMGQQALMESSEEHAGTRGLGILRGKVRRFPGDQTDPRTGERLKVPHMGWNRVHPVRSHPLWKEVEGGARFYFVHSYYVAPEDESVVAGRTSYGVAFASALAWGNVFAVQFHPEKSQRAGLALLSNFVHWDGRG